MIFESEGQPCLGQPVTHPRDILPMSVADMPVPPNYPKDNSVRCSDFRPERSPCLEHFARRVLLHAAATMAVLVISIILGMARYEHFENLPWQDAFLNVAMLTGGMGPNDAPRTNVGKLFADLYAL